MGTAGECGCPNNGDRVDKSSGMGASNRDFPSGRRFSISRSSSGGLGSGLGAGFVQHVAPQQEPGPFTRQQASAEW